MIDRAQSIPAAASYPLSYAQQRLWFLDRLQPGSAAYNSSQAYRLRGPLNVDVLASAINEIVCRHKVLRTRIDPQRGMARLSIMEPIHIPLPVVELRGDCPGGTDDVFSEEVRRPFDLESGPMIRTTLYRIAEQEHVLIIVIHHIATDGWSMEIVGRELAVLYSAFVAGHESPLPPLEAQYTDFIDYQQQRLEQGELARQLAYWRTRLSGIEALELPTDHPRPPVYAQQGGRAGRRLSPELSMKFKAVARDHRVTLFILLLATFQVLLFRHGGHKDIAVGIPVTNRERREWQSLIGLFVNTLVMRTNLCEKERFDDLLLRTGQMAINAYTHMDLPFEKLVEELAPQRDMSRNPLFQAMLTVRYPGAPLAEFAGLDSEEVAVDTGVAKFDLALDICDREPGLRLSLVYRSDLFEHDSMARLLWRFETLIRSIVANPGTLAGALEILPEPERHQLLTEWNPATGKPPTPRCVHDLFDQRAQQTPEAAALWTPHGDLAYRDLGSRADTLVNRLREHGVASGTAVGLCMERSSQLIVGLLAILKAGGTYVPLDPRFPQERLQLIVEDAAVRLVLTSASSPSLDHLSCGVLNMDASVRAESAARTNPRSEHPSPHDDAYVIFTSGSTGRPKGVPITHAAISANCEVMRECYEIVPEDRILLFSRFTFDQSLDQMLLPLSCGACVVPAPAELPDPAAFSELLHRERISVINLAPAYWRQWVRAMAAGQARQDLPRLRLVSLGGDVVPVDSVRNWRSLLLSDSVRLLNVYGPTEATISTTTYRIDSAPAGHSVPIGRPLQGRLIYILDASGGVLPTGVPGELCIGGDFLTRGYLNAPELTAQKFIPNPFVDDPRARLYRTGDRARYLPDGNIEFLGRLDFQVKIRGFRIEPGEIEHALHEHPTVQEAVVVALGEANEDKTLVAYIVPAVAGGDLSPELRTHLRKILPDYMVPAVFVSLQTLPLNPYGKVDRQALPPPGRSTRAAPDNLVAPEGDVEQALATIWRTVIGMEQIDRQDNFLDLGGNSINAMQVTARINEQFAVDLPLSIMFETNNLEELAEAVDRSLNSAPQDAGHVARSPD